MLLRALRYVAMIVMRLFLSLRYRVRIHGGEQLRGLKGPVLILPNHPGLIDPVILLTTFYPRLRPRPMMFEADDPGLALRGVRKFINAIPIPELAIASKEARARTEQSLAAAVEALRGGETILLYPAGHVQRNGTEVIGSARAVSDILRQVPEAEVLLVRTRGLWGSSFGWAPTRKGPDIGGRLRAGIGWLFANLFVLMPRRRVDVTLRRVRRDELPGLEREKLNPWLEAWYNAEGPEPPSYVPYHSFFGPRTFEFPKAASLAEVDLSKVKPRTKEAIARILSGTLRRPLGEEEAQPETTLDELGLDSLQRMEVSLTVEQRFGFSGDEVPTTIGQLWALAEGLVERTGPRPAPPEWFRPAAEHAQPPVPLADTIPEGFVVRALACRKDVAIADDMAGVLTYERLLIGALIMARRFRKLPTANVGLMMPASVAGDVALFGLYLAGKLPVILNWTTGPANLEHAARLMGLTHVVTSKAFIDRTGIEVKNTEYFYLEDIRKSVGTWEKLRTLLRVRWRPGSVRASVPRTDPDQPAVVLFTSGSERAPKAVPLTHRNLLMNERASVGLYQLTRANSVLGFLPTFHSFGLSITTLVPVLFGMKCVYHPDPTDVGGLVRKIAAYKPTLVTGTPTFVLHIFERATPEELASVKLIMVGAEKCPEALFERCGKMTPQALLVEGYGITECSPVVSVNRPGANRPGTLGPPLPGVEVCVVDLETDETLAVGKTGMLLVSGPMVFPGYLGKDVPSPFRERDGKRWYVTGDLASIDADGFIHFGGRLKRFLKAGGEMISLPALEEPFAKRYPPTEQGGVRVAVEGVEAPEGRKIVLFTTEELSVDAANDILLEEGFRGVMRLDEVRRVKEIPLLGTGKTDYKKLREWVTAGEREAEAAAR